MSRIYIGRLPNRCSERDIERFFRDYGKIREIVLKAGYGFVEFDHPRDADDAVYDLNGRELRGERVIIEHAKLPPGSRGGDRFSGPGRGFGGSSGRRESRYGPPTRTEYRAIVENLSSRISWQDLKDTMRKAGEVCYADAHRQNKNEGIVEFRSREDLKAAIERFDGYELNGRKLRVVEDRRRRSSSRSSRGSHRRRSRRSRSRSSRSGSRRRSRRTSRSGSRHSRSVSRNGASKRDHSASRSRSRSHSKSRSRSRSHSRRSDRSRSGGSRDDAGSSHSPVAAATSAAVERKRTASHSPMDDRSEDEDKKVQRRRSSRSAEEDDDDDDRRSKSGSRSPSRSRSATPTSD